MFNFLKEREVKRRATLLAPDIAREMGKRKTQANRILVDLIYHDQRLTSDLEKIAYNYTGRISDLRRRGYIIECEYVEPSVFAYKYYGFKPNTRAAKERAGK